eukprot:GHVU01226797.1.p1 GENE.GHVU01226797.1~~GHVU01226797.1.p1  ORF type:complete len:330 (-),score=106.45 GHVU01226797.1:300-1289(-)
MSTPGDFEASFARFLAAGEREVGEQEEEQERAEGVEKGREADDGCGRVERALQEAVHKGVAGRRGKRRIRRRDSRRSSLPLPPHPLPDPASNPALAFIMSNTTHVRQVVERHRAAELRRSRLRGAKPAGRSCGDAASLGRQVELEGKRRDAEGDSAGPGSVRKVRGGGALPQKKRRVQARLDSEDNYGDYDSDNDNDDNNDDNDDDNFDYNYDVNVDGNYIITDDDDNVNDNDVNYNDVNYNNDDVNYNIDDVNDNYIDDVNYNIDDVNYDVNYNDDFTVGGETTGGGEYTVVDDVVNYNDVDNADGEITAADYLDTKVLLSSSETGHG